MAFSLANKPERFVQTSTAIFGVTTLFMPALIPMVAALLPYIEKPDPAVQPPAALSLLCAVLGVWLLIVQVRIVRAAFEWPYVVAIVFIFGTNFARASGLSECCSEFRPNRLRGRVRTMHVHILGICGTFMGGIAAIAKAAGHRVTGFGQERLSTHEHAARGARHRAHLGFRGRRSSRRGRTWWSWATS